MLRRLLTEWKAWNEAIGGLDHPVDDEILDLGKRIQKLEEELSAMRLVTSFERSDD
ncbi:hypothetical protein SAMN05444272_4482 [Roseibium suaedae]|uniref:Uncharacterized protein n=1 Tax=Roseibium suaedae TaxID=735517 RepID=A0A1M7PKD5_9HYPH|nr:hypothetical protein SAMN05444272_4482 [Roseibium suaedae]